MAGYSGTPLTTKLGIKEGTRLGLFGAPPGFSATLGELPARVELAEAGLDVAVFFALSAAALAERWRDLTTRMQPNGGLWIGWPKRASGVPTDLTENMVREIGLPSGWVDNKVCAIDDTWSGLRFVLRLDRRPKQP